MAQLPPNKEFDNYVQPLRRPGRWVAAAVLVFLFVAFAHAIATNKNIDFPTIAEYMFHGRILSGVQITVMVTLISMTSAAILAVLLAAMRLSGNPVFVAFSAL